MARTNEAGGGPDGTGPGGHGRRPARPSRFWEEPGGLDLFSARLLPDRRTIELSFRGGQAYQLDLGALGFAGPGLFATLDARGRGVVLALSGGQLVDLAPNRLLAAAEPEFREALERAAEAPASVGALIRSRRLAAGLTAAQVAASAGMAPSNYARLEASRHQPRIDTLRRVATALGVALPVLLTRAPYACAVTPPARSPNSTWMRATSPSMSMGLEK